MIKDTAFWEAWEARGPQAEPADYARNLAIFDAMIEQARAMGVWPPSDLMAGLDEKIRWIAALHGHRQHHRNPDPTGSSAR